MTTGSIRTATGLASLAACVEAVTAHFALLFGDLETMRAEMARLVGPGTRASVEVAAAVEPLAREVRRTHPVVGAGFVAAPGTLPDCDLFLAWYQGDADLPLGQSGSPASGEPIDYTRLEWFRTPRATGERHVTGPYVDYVCTDEYVMTATAPVVVDGVVVGVVGADTLVETLERLLLPTLRAAGATVVNLHGRTVVSADPHLPTGRIVDTLAYDHAVTCDGLPLTVLG